MSLKFGWGTAEQRYGAAGGPPNDSASNIIIIKGNTKKYLFHLGVANLIVDNTTWLTTPVAGRLVVITGSGTIDPLAFYEPLFAPSAGFPDNLKDFSLLFDITYLGQGHQFFSFSSPLETNDQLIILATPVYSSTAAPGPAGIQSCLQRLYAHGVEVPNGETDNYLSKGSWR